MKILMTTDAVGGVWQYCLDLARGLVGEGADILLATMGPKPSPSQREEVALIPRVRLVESDLALEWMERPWRDVESAGSWLLHLAAEFQPDIVHLNGYCHAALPWGKPVLVVAHSCVFSWWRAVHGCAPGSEWDEYRSRVSAGLSSASAIVAPSRYMARAIADEYGVLSSKLHVVHNFSRSPRFQSGSKQPFLLAAGRIWDPAKNLAVLDSVADQLHWPVRVAGDQRGPEGNADVSPQIELLGRLRNGDLIEEMQRAAIFVHTALYEPFGLAVLEAARANCCLVLSDIESLRELWDRTAVFVSPRDPEQWKFELNRLSRNRLIRENFAAQAFERSSAYRAFCSTTEYVELYEKLTATAKGKEVAA